MSRLVHNRLKRVHELYNDNLGQSNGPSSKATTYTSRLNGQVAIGSSNLRLSIRYRIGSTGIHRHSGLLNTSVHTIGGHPSSGGSDFPIGGLLFHGQDWRLTTSRAGMSKARHREVNSIELVSAEPSRRSVCFMRLFGERKRSLHESSSRSARSIILPFPLISPESKTSVSPLLFDIAWCTWAKLLLRTPLFGMTRKVECHHSTTLNKADSNKRARRIGSGWVFLWIIVNDVCNARGVIESSRACKTHIEVL